MTERPVVGLPDGPEVGTVGEALRFCLRPRYLRRTIRIALVVGTIVTLINQADVILAGATATTTWLKLPINYCVPFVVSNLGLLAGRRDNLRDRNESEELDTGTNLG